MRKSFFFFIIASLALLGAGCSQKNQETSGPQQSVAPNQNSQAQGQAAATADSSEVIIQAVTKLLAAKYKKDPADLHVVLLLAQGNFARGGVDIKGDERGAMFLAMKGASGWTLPFVGFSAFSCAQAEEDGFPKAMIEDCDIAPETPGAPTAAQPDSGGNPPAAPGNSDVKIVLPKFGGKTVERLGFMSKKFSRTTIAPDGNSRTSENTKMVFEVFSMTPEVTVANFFYSYKCEGRVEYSRTRLVERLSAGGQMSGKIYSYDVEPTFAPLDWCRLVIDKNAKSFGITASVRDLPIITNIESCASNSPCASTHQPSEENPTISVNGVWQAGQSFGGKTTDGEGWKIEWALPSPLDT